MLTVRIENKIIEQMLGQESEETKVKIVEKALAMYLATQQKLQFDLYQAEVRILVRPRVEVVQR